MGRRRSQSSSSVTDSTNIDYPKPGLQTRWVSSSLQLNNDGEGDIPYGNSSSRSSRAAIPVSIDETAESTNSAPPTLSPNPDVLNPDQNGCVFARGSRSVRTRCQSPSRNGGTLPQCISGSPEALPLSTTSGSDLGTVRPIKPSPSRRSQQTVIHGGNEFDEGLNTANSATEVGSDCR